MSIWNALFGGNDDALLTLLHQRGRELQRIDREAWRYRAMYEDLRRQLATRCSPTGAPPYTLEPLAGILNEHDKKVRVMGWDEPLYKSATN